MHLCSTLLVFAGRCRLPKRFFPGWLCRFKGLLVPVRREIFRSKILPVTSWQLTNKKVSDISRCFRHSICQSFFSAGIYDMIQIHSGETSRTRDFVARSVAARPHALKLASLNFRTYERSTCSKSTVDSVFKCALIFEVPGPFPPSLLTRLSNVKYHGGLFLKLFILNSHARSSVPPQNSIPQPVPNSNPHSCMRNE